MVGDETGRMEHVDLTGFKHQLGSPRSLYVGETSSVERVRGRLDWACRAAHVVSGIGNRDEQEGNKGSFGRPELSLNNLSSLSPIIPQHLS